MNRDDREIVWTVVAATLIAAAVVLLGAVCVGLVA